MRTALAGPAVLAAAIVCPSAHAQPPARVGACSQSVIVRIGTRFSPRLVKPRQGEMDEGTSVEMRNGVYGISYEYVAAIGRSRVGDRVTTCLVSLPRDCPKGDDRGKRYRTTNLRTRESWTLPDSQHLCGGA